MEYRPYRQGDEASKVDWKLFARTERLAIRLSHDDSSLPTMILVDASASMAYPVDSRDKWELAAAIALGLTAVAHGDTDPVGVAIVAGDQLRVIPARTRGGTVANVMNALTAVEPTGSAPLTPVLGTLRSAKRLVIVSDFLGDADDLVARAGELVAGGREVFAVHVIAREELEPSVRGAVVVDPEDAETKRPFDDAAMAEYREAFASWRDSLATRFRAVGAVYQVATTDEKPDQVVRRIARPVQSAAAS